MLDGVVLLSDHAIKHGALCDRAGGLVDVPLPDLALLFLRLVVALEHEEVKEVVKVGERRRLVLVRRCWVLGK